MPIESETVTGVIPGPVSETVKVWLGPLPLAGATLAIAEFPLVTVSEPVYPASVAVNVLDVGAWPTTKLRFDGLAESGPGVKVAIGVGVDVAPDGSGVPVAIDLGVAVDMGVAGDIGVSGDIGVAPTPIGVGVDDEPRTGPDCGPPPHAASSVVPDKRRTGTTRCNEPWVNDSMNSPKDRSAPVSMTQQA